MYASHTTTTTTKKSTVKFETGFIFHSLAISNPTAISSELCQLCLNEILCFNSLSSIKTPTRLFKYFLSFLVCFFLFLYTKKYGNLFSFTNFVTSTCKLKLVEIYQFNDVEKNNELSKFSLASADIRI